MTYTKASAEKDFAGYKVIYTDDQGNITEYRGGTLSWRNNNPGNIINGKWAIRHGAIGNNGRFAIFASPDDGRKAKLTLLQTKYINYNSIREVIKGRFDPNGKYIENTAYAPASDGNDPDLYADQIRQWTGIDVDNKKIADLTEKEWQQLVDAMRKKEGWKTGQVVNRGHVIDNGKENGPGQTRIRTIFPSIATTYLIKPGDTLSRIARINNISIAEIVAANPSVTNINRICVGQKLILPTRKASGPGHTNHATRPATARKPRIGDQPKQSWSLDSTLGWTKHHK
ncbi:LysM peptidoglycan-binding domain-containing protein [Geobacter pickeringii]|uniref:LysM peptidoglycan-binding domain-containing protein n=1 Tax=Geobacter pickeringii TaxID=345632 RepID=UPI000A070B26|nr:LysM domain-containing protein [Geobacter pickeringii]